MVNTRQFSGSTYMQDMTKSHKFSAKNQGSTYTPIRLIRREIRYTYNVRACLEYSQQHQHFLNYFLPKFYFKERETKSSDF